MRILLEHGLVVSMDKARRVIPNGAVIVENDQIESVCSLEDVGDRGRFDSVINATGKAILPGLVNCHTHLNEKLFPGMRDDLPLFDWLNSVVRPHVVASTEEDCYLSALLGCLEMIKGGTTCFADMFCQETEKKVLHRVTQAVDVSGIRGILSRVMCDNTQRPDIPESLRSYIEKVPDDIVERVIRETVEASREVASRNQQRIMIRFAPGSMMCISPSMADRIGELSKENHLGIHTHFSEIMAEVEHMERKYGLRPISFAGKHGLLGPQVLGAHCVHLSEWEIELLAKTRTNAVYNPVANMKLADGVSPVPRLLERGITVALGSDGAASNDNLDMFGVMKSASYLQKIHNCDAGMLPSQQVLEMATLGGARALQMEEKIGSLEPRKKADLILVNLRDPNLVPTHPETVVNQLVCSATAANVDTVLADGRVVMKNRRVQTLDETEVVEKATEASRSLMARAGLLTQI